MSNETFSVGKTVRGNPNISGLPFLDIKNEVLGKDYELSLTFIGDHLSRRLNRKHRGKNRPTNILSFTIEDSLGEIFIDYPLAKREAKRYGFRFKNYLLYLFIHGVHHLKGYTHGSTMEKQEEKIRRKFRV